MSHTGMGSTLGVVELPDRGRGLVAQTAIESGEVVLQELPLMLYPQESWRRSVCSFCLRSLALAGAAVVACSSCQHAGYCSQACAAAAAADPASHSQLVCRCLAACNMAGLTDEQQTSLHFLLRATSLRQAAAQAGTAGAAPRYAALCSLAGGAGPAELGSMEVRELHGRLGHALAAAGAAAALPSLQEVGDLLRKEAINGYGIMAPSGPEGERQVRGGGIYPRAALVNHDCLPNLARFDCFDTPAAAAQAPGANTAIQLRALHDIPPGEELTQSYFPLTWHYSERQQRCLEQYGFTCTCPRCKEEATWQSSDDEGSDEWMTDDEAGKGEGEACGLGEVAEGDADARGLAHSAVDSAAAASGTASAAVVKEGPQADAAYISVFLLKYVCPRPECFGTLAPAQQGSDTSECNMCGMRRTEAEFLAELQAGQ
ncbi:hypothetical protein N2152v2_002955 [Parachlorella kessleri]